MKKTLPRLSEYVKQQDIINGGFGVEEAENVWDYTNFITQPLNISHFVPAELRDNEWVVFEEPKEFKDWQLLPDDMRRFRIINQEICKKYQTAFNNVVFKGFEYQNREHLEDFSILKNDILSFNYDEKYRTFEKNRCYLETIEDLIHYNLEINDWVKEKYNL